MTCLVYVVAGDPIPKARPRVYRRRGGKRGRRTVTITEPRTVAYEGRVKLAAHAALRAARRAGIAWDMGARIEVQLVIHRATRRAADVDNIGKAWADGSQGVLYRNDAQIDHMTISRGCVDKAHPRLVVLVRAMTVAESEAAAQALEQLMGEEAA